jgi:hypothetical protein
VLAWLACFPLPYRLSSAYLFRALDKVPKETFLAVPQAVDRANAPVKASKVLLEPQTLLQHQLPLSR